MKDKLLDFIFLDHPKIAGALFIIFGVAVVIGLSYGPELSTQTDYILTVTDKTVKNGSNFSKYLIYCEDESGEVMVLEDTDALLLGKVNSSDIYANIKIGKTYKFHTRGIRFRLFSWYPNIYSYEVIEKDNP